MNKKLVKTRFRRMNTLEAMECPCGCTTCKNCSAGGSFKETERKNRMNVKLRAAIWFA